GNDIYSKSQTPTFHTKLVRHHYLPSLGGRCLMPLALCPTQPSPEGLLTQPPVGDMPGMLPCKRRQPSPPPEPPNRLQHCDRELINARNRWKNELAGGFPCAFAILAGCIARLGDRS